MSLLQCSSAVSQSYWLREQMCPSKYEVEAKMKD